MAVGNGIMRHSARPVVMAVGMALMLELAADVTFGAPVVMAVGMAVGSSARRNHRGHGRAGPPSPPVVMAVAAYTEPIARTP